jgi:putative transposase
MNPFGDQNNPESTRLKGWDYSEGGEYFITICTRGRMLFFGKVVNTEIELSKLGRVAYKYWEEIPEDHEGVDMDEFVIMPNHIHGIVFLPPKTYVNPPFDTVETLHATSLQSNVSRKMSKISPRKGSLSVVIRSYKSAVTRWAHQNGYNHFQWQPRFYDYIIRDDSALVKIRSYIRNNPIQWEFDRFYSTASQQS